MSSAAIFVWRFKGKNNTLIVIMATYLLYYILAPLGEIDRHSLVNLGLVYTDNHPTMQLKKFRCQDSKVTTDTSIGIVEASTFSKHAGSFMVRSAL